MIEILKIFFAFLVLVYASVLDWRYREIDDKSWLSLVALGIALLFYSLEIENFLISVAATAIFGLALSHLGLMGGGDAKILVGIAFLFPVYPNAATLFPIFAISVFMNAVLLSALLPLFFFIYNLKHLKEVKSMHDFFILFLGYKKDASQIKSYEAVLESIFLNVNKVQLGKKNGGDEVWVTPALPFLIPITFGFLIAAFFGDLASFMVMELTK